MFQKVTDAASCDIFAMIYNSAILLFDERDRAEATGDIFRSQIENDINYICYNDVYSATAFFSYRQYADNLFELTSLYVRKDCQRAGVGQSCYLFLEGLLPKESTVYVKALNNAPWSIRFYQKMGFEDASADSEILKTKYGIRIEPWSNLLKKTVSM